MFNHWTVRKVPSITILNKHLLLHHSSNTGSFGSMIQVTSVRTPITPKWLNRLFLSYLETKFRDPVLPQSNVKDSFFLSPQSVN